MAKANCKILIYDTSDALIHTVTTEDILGCTVKPILTSDIGTFNFSLPAQNGFTYVYNDIGAFYKAEMYFGYETLTSNDLQLTGRILKIANQYAGNQSIRTFQGKDLGEQLERQFMKNKGFLKAAGDIVKDDIATELGILNYPWKMDDDTNIESLTIRTKSYLEVLKTISDFWVDSSHRVQKDFYVDAVNDLVWKTRGTIRTEGVETLTYGENILGYTLTYDIMPTKNSITVYGAPTAYLPDDKDSYTESLGTEWTASSGNLTADNSYQTPKAGTNLIRCTFTDNDSPYAQDVTFQRTLPRITLRDINKLNFWYYPGRTASGYNNLTCRLQCPDDDHYVELNLNTTMVWHFADIALGDSAIYDADEHPSGPWTTSYGSPNWWNIQGIRFHGDSTGSAGALILCVDKLYFSPDRWVGFAEDVANSQAFYGLREAEYTDENLLSDDDCTKRANSLLMQLKEKTIAVELKTPGNTNIKIGDRIPLTLPPDNISGIDFDVVSVEHAYSNSGFQTTAEMLYSNDKRVFPPKTVAESLNRNIQQLRSVTSEIYSRIIR